MSVSSCKVQLCWESVAVRHASVYTQVPGPPHAVIMSCKTGFEKWTDKWQEKKSIQTFAEITPPSATVHEGFPLFFEAVGPLPSVLCR